MIGKGKTAPKAKNHGSKKTALCKPFCKKETGLSCRSLHDPHDGLCDDNRQDNADHDLGDEISTVIYQAASVAERARPTAAITMAT